MEKGLGFWGFLGNGTRVRVWGLGSSGFSGRKRQRNRLSWNIRQVSRGFM